MNNWFTVKVKYTKQLENGTFKRVTEPYLLAAMTFTDAEARIYEELGSVVRGEFVVTSIQRTEFHDIFATEGTEKWCVVKISYQTYTEEKSKLITNKFLVGSDSIEQATDVITEELKSLMADYRIESVVNSNIVDVFAWKTEQDSETKAPSSEMVLEEEIGDDLP